MSLDTFNEITIESEESKTVHGGPIFNKITFIKKGTKEIWMMNQAHNGLKGDWDRLAIVIDSSFSPNKVKFLQLNSGQLKWDNTVKKVAYKVPCFICHSNGPRAIRPNYSSKSINYSLKTKLKIFLWNMKIKSYGKLVEYPNQKFLDNREKPPFRTRGKYENEKLQIKTCTNCHKEQGFMARGSLTRQHKITIKHMLDKGHMPPLGFSLTESEKEDMEIFLKGF